jgi:hypothetical protein
MYDQAVAILHNHPAPVRLAHLLSARAHFESEQGNAEHALAAADEVHRLLPSAGVPLTRRLDRLRDRIALGGERLAARAVTRRQPA